MTAPTPDLVDPIAAPADTPASTPPPGTGAPSGRTARGVLVTLAMAAGVVVAIILFVAAPLVGSARLALVVAALGLGYAALRRIWRLIFGPESDFGVWCAVAWMAAIILAAAFADLLPLPESLDPSKALLELPLAPPSSSHWLGTDQYGLDILGQIIYGARVSLVVGFGGVVIGGTVGVCVGLVAGYFRGRVEGALGWMVDLILSFPPLVLLMALAAVLEPRTRNICLALAILVIPSFARLARATTLKIAEQDFVFMARAMGAPRRRIMFREVLPNILPSLLSYGLLVMAVLIVAEASLSFLGLSIQRPSPTWGNMIAEAEPRFEEYPFLLSPAIPLFLTVFSINRIGDAIRARQGRD